MFQAKVVEKSKHAFVFGYLFQKSCHLSDNVEKYGRGRLALYNNIIRWGNGAICMPGK
jgi:hypothetical protein